MAYRTRSDTLKLQRLIDVLKERGSETATNLETSASDFLNDVKPKYKPGEIPHYDGTESDDGSSYVEGQSEEEDWNDEDWEDCTDEFHTPPRSSASSQAPPPTLNTSSPPLNIPTSSTNNNQRNVPSSSPVLKTPPLIYDELVSSNNMVDSNIPGEISLDQDLTKEETDYEDDGQGLGPLLDLVPTSRIKAKLSFANGSSSKPTTPSTMNTLKSTFSTSISSSSVSKTSNTGSTTFKNSSSSSTTTNSNSSSLRRDSKSTKQETASSTNLGDPKTTNSSAYKPTGILSGVEKSSDVASALMKFPTLPVSIPNFFSSSSSSNSMTSPTSTTTSAASSESKKVPKKKTSTTVPTDAVESVLVDSMSVATAVIVPNKPSINQVRTSTDSSEVDSGSRKNSKDFECSDVIQSQEVSKNVLNDQQTCGSLKSVQLEKSPLRSILKKSPSTSSAVFRNSSPTFVDSFCGTEVNKSKSLSSLYDPKVSSSIASKTINHTPIVNHLALSNLVTSQQKTMEVKFGTSEIYPIEKHNDDSVITDEVDANNKHLEPSTEEMESTIKPPKSLLTALIQESEDPPHIMMKAKSPPKKHVTLQIPDKKPETEIGMVPQKSKSPKPISPPPCGSEAVGTIGTAGTKRPVLKPQPQLQYQVPEGAKIPKVGGQRSKKPTLASQWRKQKEKQKLEERNDGSGT